VLAVGLIFYFIVPFLIIMFINNKKVSNILMCILFAMFLVILFVGIYFKVSFVGNKVYAVPDFSGEWFNKTINLSFSSIPKFDFVINIIMLIPIGIVCRYLTRNKKIWARILILLCVAFISGILTELGQFILPIPRGVQLSDSVLNMISVVIGSVVASVYYLIKKVVFKGRRGNET
jgi:VanZ family protein